MRSYITLLRPYQYVKNLFIFLPLFFGQKIFEIDLLSKTFVAFVAFSLIASAVYIFNDYHDVEADRSHPIKKNRPLASGAIAVRTALALMIILLVGGLGMALILMPRVLYLIFLYLLLNFLYTIRLKHIAIVDVSIIAIGFVVRLFVGSETSGIDLSVWIVLMTFLLALFLALAKRRDDILIYVDNGQKTRKVIDGYSLEFLNASMMVMASVVIVSYIMYTQTAEVIRRLNSDKLYLTVFFVILGMMRYMQISFVEKNSGAPTKTLLKDKFIQITILGWLLTFGILLY
jgi:decaprenyl-phosphate phosphoribosyltransferase